MCSRIALISGQMFKSTIPVPKINTSHKLSIRLFPFLVIVSDVPVALYSHGNDLISPVDMLLLDDPHLLSCGPTEILKLRNQSPVVQVMQ